MVFRACLKRFPVLDRAVDRLVYWWLFLGPGGVVAAVMSWVASKFAPIAEYGIGAIIFAGLGAACILMLVASISLIAWRYFHPLPETPTTSEDATKPENVVKLTAVGVTGGAGLDEKIAELNRKIDGYTAEVKRINDLGVQIHGSSEFLRKRLDELQNHIALAAGKIAGLEADEVSQKRFLSIVASESNMLINAAYYHFNLALLYALPRKPDLSEISALTAGRMDQDKALADKYVTDIMANLERTEWCDGTKMIHHNAEIQADALLRQTPQEQQPTGINFVDLRRYVISKIRAEELSKYIFYKQREQTIVKIRDSLLRSKKAMQDRDALNDSQANEGRAGG